MLTAIFWGLAAVFGLIHLNRYAFRSENKRLVSEEETRCLIVIERDPTNAGAHAQLADLAYERGDLELAIHEWRTAVRLLPEGPFTLSWKRKLKRVLAMQEQIARGERPVPLHEMRVCPKCEADLPARAKACPALRRNALHEPGRVFEPTRSRARMGQRNRRFYNCFIIGWNYLYERVVGMERSFDNVHYNCWRLLFIKEH